MASDYTKEEMTKNLGPLLDNLRVVAVTIAHYFLTYSHYVYESAYLESITVCDSILTHFWWCTGVGYIVFTSTVDAQAAERSWSMSMVQ